MSYQLILVDGSSYLFRAYHGLPPLTNRDGEPTGAMVGVINMLRKLFAEHPVENMAVVFDAKGKTFRHDMYDEYKANRAAMPDELRVQIEPLQEMIRAMGYPLIIQEGVEADDVIGSLAAQASSEGINTLISTGDKDMAQLVNEHVTLVNTMNWKYMDPDGVVEKFGVTPAQIIDYLSLVGDTSDNIPGIPGVGPKTAAKWLGQYETLDNLVASHEEIKGKIGEKLKNNLDQLPLSKSLTTIKLDLSLPTFHELKRQEPDVDTLKQFYSRYEFKHLLKTLESDSVAVSASIQSPKDYETILSQDAFDAWVKKLKASKLFALDLETTSLQFHEAEIVGISFAVSTEGAAYVPVAHTYEGAPEQLSREAVLATLKPLLEDPAAQKVGHNLKYDAKVFAQYDITLAGIKHDSMLASYVLDSVGTRHDMDSVAKKYLGRETVSYETVAGKGAKQIGFDQVPLETAAPYAAEDAEVSLSLHETLYPKLEQTPALLKVYEALEMPLLPVLKRMEQTGVRIDTDMLLAQSKSLGETLEALEAQAHALADQTFNLNSPKQLQEILFGQLGLPILEKTPKGQPSTAESVLQQLADDFALPEIILNYRQLGKIKSTYTDRLPEQVCKKTGRLHTSYHQAVTATGRLSSSDPNLQNIPIRTEEGRRVRQAFVPEAGYTMLAADYSQIELRIMAHLSQDEGLLSAFAAGKDIHRATAADIFEIDVDEVSSEQRRAAKAINFGLIYGMSAFGLAKQIGTSRYDAQSYMDLYFTRYPGVQDYMIRTREQAAAQGYVETLLGRRLYLPDINARHGGKRKGAERTAINAPMQGTAADIIKKAMITIDDWITQSGVPVRMLMQVHDELVFEVAEDKLTEATEMIRTHMVEAMQLDVPLVVDIGVGVNWDEAH